MINLHLLYIYATFEVLCEGIVKSRGGVRHADTQDMQARADTPTRMGVFGGEPDSTHETLAIYGDGLRQRIDAKFKLLAARFARIQLDLRVQERPQGGLRGLRQNASEPDLRSDPRPDTFHNFKGTRPRTSEDKEEEEKEGDDDGHFFKTMAQLQTIKARRLAARESSVTAAQA